MDKTIKEAFSTPPFEYTQFQHLHPYDAMVCHWERSGPLKPGHLRGPILRDYYMIQYCLSGRGTVYIDKVPHPMEAGQCIVYPPQSIVSEIADLEEPWQMLWLGITGVQLPAYLTLMGISQEKPMFSWRNNASILEYMEQIAASGDPVSALDMSGSENMELRMERQALLYLIFAELLRNSEPVDDTHQFQRRYVEKAIEFMESFYQSKITIQDIAHHVGLSRSHLFSLFKKLTNRSPQEYLALLRVKKACEFFHNPYATITDVAYSLGYDDPNSFSRLFKQTMNITPSEYRRQMAG